MCDYSDSIEDLRTYYILRSTMHLSSGRIRESIEAMDTVVSIYQKHTTHFAHGHSINEIYIDKASITLLDGEFEQHRDDLASVIIFDFDLILFSFFFFFQQKLTFPFFPKKFSPNRFMKFL